MTLSFTLCMEPLIPATISSKESAVPVLVGRYLHWLHCYLEANAGDETHYKHFLQEDPPRDPFPLHLIVLFEQNKITKAPQVSKSIHLYDHDVMSQHRRLEWVLSAAGSCLKEEESVSCVCFGKFYLSFITYKKAPIRASGDQSKLTCNGKMRRLGSSCCGPGC